MKTARAQAQLKTQELLRLALLRKQGDNPAYSMRALARDLRVSPSYVSFWMNGKKRIPQKRVAEICRCLSLDEVKRTQLERAVSTAHGYDSPSAAGRPAIEKFHDAPQRQQVLTEFWYQVALLDLVTCRGFKAEKSWIARRLSITEDQSVQALHFLETSGHIRKNPNGTYEKTRLLVRHPTHRSTATVRNFHRQMIRKSLDELGRADEPSFKNRLISGITMAVNPEHLPRAREILADAMHEIATTLTQGECTEVFQLNCQLFPLTR